MASAYPCFFQKGDKPLHKTEYTHKNRNISRLVAVLSLVLLLIPCLCLTTYATTTTTPPSYAADIEAMNDKIYTIYRVIRNDIAFPLLVVSFASCGFKFLGIGFIGSGAGADKGIQSAKQQLVTSTLALLVLLLLPYIMTAALNLFKANAWTPGIILPIHWLQGGIP